MTEASACQSAHAESVAHLGPLASLAGTWDGDQGTDIAHSNSECPRTTFPGTHHVHTPWSCG